MKLPIVYMRGGTSKALFVQKSDLPEEIEYRDKILMKIMGSPEVNQIDGIANGDALTNKIAIVNKSNRENADVDFLFAQIDLESRSVNTDVNCGNIIAGVAPYSLSKNIIQANHPTTTVKIFNINTKTVIESVVETPLGVVNYEGKFKIDGVPGSGSPIYLNFPNSVGKIYGTILPTGSPVNEIEGVKFSLIDVAVPVIFIAGNTFGLQGYESKEQISNNAELLSKLRHMREKILSQYQLKFSAIMPKIALICEPSAGGDISSRYFTPNECHSAHAITGGICLVAAACIQGTVVNELHQVKLNNEKVIIEHPAGKLTIEIEVESFNPLSLKRVSIVRTARPLFDGVGVIT